MPALSGSSPNKWTCGRMGPCTERFRASGRHYNLVSACCAPSQIQSTQFTDVHCHGLGKVSRLRMGHHHRDEELFLSINLMQHSEMKVPAVIWRPCTKYTNVQWRVYITWWYLMSRRNNTPCNITSPSSPFLLDLPPRHATIFVEGSLFWPHFTRGIVVFECTPHMTWRVAGGQNSANQPPSSQTHLSKET